MSVKIQFDEARVLERFDISNPAIMQPMAEEILADCNEFCKMDTGALIASSLIHSRLAEGKLIWQTPYAKRQYWAIRTAYADMNPQATWRWAEAAKERYSEKWARQLQALMGGKVRIERDE